MAYYATLKKILDICPAPERFEVLLAHFGKAGPEDGLDDPVSIITVLDSNGIGDALLWLMAYDGVEREARSFAVWCVQQVKHLLQDGRSLAALEVAEKYSNGRANTSELVAASNDAWAVVNGSKSLAHAAWSAARAAALAVARSAAVSAWSVAKEAALALAWGESEAEAEADAKRWNAAYERAREGQSAEFRRVFRDEGCCTTPSPWIVNERSSSGDVDPYHIFIEPNVAVIERKTDDRYDMADARVIAAAPELLAVLREVFSDAEAVARLSWIERAAAVIAKAEGKA